MEEKTPQDVGLQPKPNDVAIVAIWGGQNDRHYCLGSDERVYVWQHRFATWVLDTRPVVKR